MFRGLWAASRARVSTSCRKNDARAVAAARGDLALRLGALQNLDGSPDVDERVDALRLAGGKPDAAVRGRIRGNVRVLVRRDPAHEVRGVRHPDLERDRPRVELLAVDAVAAARRRASRPRRGVHRAHEASFPSSSRRTPRSRCISRRCPALCDVGFGREPRKSSTWTCPSRCRCARGPPSPAAQGAPARSGSRARRSRPSGRGSRGSTCGAGRRGCCTGSPARRAPGARPPAASRGGTSSRASPPRRPRRNAAVRRGTRASSRSASAASGRSAERPVPAAAREAVAPEISLRDDEAKADRAPRERGAKPCARSSRVRPRKLAERVPGRAAPFGTMRSTRAILPLRRSATSTVFGLTTVFTAPIATGRAARGADPGWRSTACVPVSASTSVTRRRRIPRAEFGTERKTPAEWQLRVVAVDDLDRHPRARLRASIRARSSRRFSTPYFRAGAGRCRGRPRRALARRSARLAPRRGSWPQRRGRGGHEHPPDLPRARPTWTSRRRPSSLVTHTGVETGDPSRLKVVRLMYRSSASAATTVPPLYTAYIVSVHRTLGRCTARTRAGRDRPAITLADDGGLDAVSLRRVADKLGVTPMALYRHVASKDDLLDAMAIACTGARPAWADEPWWEALACLARTTREAVLARPWSAPALRTAARRTARARVGHGAARDAPRRRLLGERSDELHDQLSRMTFALVAPELAGTPNRSGLRARPRAPARRARGAAPTALVTAHAARATAGVPRRPPTRQGRSDWRRAGGAPPRHRRAPTPRTSRR